MAMFNNQGVPSENPEGKPLENSYTEYMVENEGDRPQVREGGEFNVLSGWWFGMCSYIYIYICKHMCMHIYIYILIVNTCMSIHPSIIYE